MKGIGPILAKQLVAYCGSAKAVFHGKSALLAKVPGVAEHLARQIKAFDQFSSLEVMLRKMENMDVQVIPFYSSHYPARLKHTEDHPLVLFCKGELRPSPPRIMAVVGSRNMSKYGKEILDRFFLEIAGSQVEVVSGLAYGVDHYAHRLSLEYGMKTTAILAHGLDRIYPGLHKGTARSMIEKGGALISEFIFDVLPERENFPKRNRIIAGMVDLVVVIESAESGGSLITADLACQYNREVACFPGSVFSELSKGCNVLIKEHRAQCVLEAEDVLKLMNWDQLPKNAIQIPLFTELSENEKLIYTSLREGIKSFDHLLRELNFSHAQLSTLLLDMELKKFISSLPGMRYDIHGRT